MRAPARSRSCRARAAWSRFVFPALTTISTASTFRANTAASETASTGGLSNSRRSASCWSRPIAASIRLEPSSSDGFGGCGPLVSSRKPSTGVSTSGGAADWSASSIVVSPWSLATPNSLWSDGRRRSQSTKITRLPACANVTPRLASVVDFPSSWPALETSSERTGWSTLESWTLVRSVRYASATGERGLASVTSSECSTDSGALLAASGGGRPVRLGVAVPAAGAADHRRGVRDRRQQRRAEVAVDILRRLERVVQELEQERQHQPGKHGEHRRRGHDLRPLRPVQHRGL